jgi:hypothetical protein
MAMRAIVDVRPDAVFVQSESSEYFHAESPRALARAEFLNERRLLALDLTYSVPVSAYSLTDQVDWDTALREDNGRVNPCGLVDMDRKLRPVGAAYADLITDWRAHPILSSHTSF